MPWLTNSHVHLLYFDLIRKQTIKLAHDRIDQLTMSDGGITAIAWYGYNLPPGYTNTGICGMHAYRAATVHLRVCVNWYAI